MQDDIAVDRVNNMSRKWLAKRNLPKTEALAAMFDIPSTRVHLSDSNPETPVYLIEHDPGWSVIWEPRDLPASQERWRIGSTQHRQDVLRSHAELRYTDPTLLGLTVQLATLADIDRGYLDAGIIERSAFDYVTLATVALQLWWDHERSTGTDVPTAALILGLAELPALGSGIEEAVFGPDWPFRDPQQATTPV